MMTQVRIGIGQFSPVHMDLQASLQKLDQIMKQAKSEKVNLLVMGESWLSGYPAWIDHCSNVAQWDNEAMKEVFLKLYKSSVTIEGDEMKHIRKAAQENGLVLCLGFNERKERGPGNGTLYNSFVIINEHGQLLNHHRKLVPTFTERMLYGLGDGLGLKSAETIYGRISASICWEHWMPLTRQALHNSGEHIHVALWPNVHEMLQIASRHYAFEGRCFVSRVRDFPAELEVPADLASNPDQMILRGGSCVIDPQGRYVVDPVFDREELIIANIESDHVYKERMTLDTSGHYQRDDVFNFQVKGSRN